MFVTTFPLYISETLCASQKRKVGAITLSKQKTEDLAKEIRRKYMREWRKKNPEKVREYNRKHWERKAEQLQQEDQENE